MLFTWMKDFSPSINASDEQDQLSGNETFFPSDIAIYVYRAASELHTSLGAIKFLQKK